MSSRFSQVVASMPEVDRNRVEEVRQRLAAGTYEVNPARIANRMLSMERAFA
ncbi:negative regulator of flagellin synthesis FlgM [Gammaproteobacteria bacterium]